MADRHMTGNTTFAGGLP